MRLFFSSLHSHAYSGGRGLNADGVAGRVAGLNECSGRKYFMGQRQGNQQSLTSGLFSQGCQHNFVRLVVLDAPVSQGGKQVTVRAGCRGHAEQPFSAL